MTPHGAAPIRAPLSYECRRRMVHHPSSIWSSLRAGSRRPPQQGCRSPPVRTAPASTWVGSLSSASSSSSRRISCGPRWHRGSRSSASSRPSRRSGRRSISSCDARSSPRATRCALEPSHTESGEPVICDRRGRVGGGDRRRLQHRERARGCEHDARSLDDRGLAEARGRRIVGRHRERGVVLRKLTSAVMLPPARPARLSTPAVERTDGSSRTA